MNFLGTVFFSKAPCSASPFCRHVVIGTRTCTLFKLVTVLWDSETTQIHETETITAPVCCRAVR